MGHLKTRLHSRAQAPKTPLQNPSQIPQKHCDFSEKPTFFKFLLPVNQPLTSIFTKNEIKNYGIFTFLRLCIESINLTMEFKADKHYYLHNFGIDYQKIFFSEEHKNYFKKKITKYIAPYAKVISVKLADNQFHILIKTHKNYEDDSLNFNIGVMLRSYTRAINKQRNRIGSLFCSGTKAFSKISDIPRKLRDFTEPFIKYFKKGAKINFEKSISSFLNFLKPENIKKVSETFTKHERPFTEIFNHPITNKKCT